MTLLEAAVGPKNRAAALYPPIFEMQQDYWPTDRKQKWLRE